MVDQNIDFTEAQTLHKTSKFLSDVLCVECLLVVILLVVLYSFQNVIANLYLIVVNALLAIKSTLQLDPVVFLRNGNCTVLAEFVPTANFFQTRMSD